LFRSVLTIAIGLTGLMPPGAAAQNQPAPPGPSIATTAITTAAAATTPSPILTLTQTPPPAQPPAQTTTLQEAAPAADPAPVEAFLPLDFEEHGAPEAPFGNLIYEMAGRYAINPYLVAAVVQVESSFNPRAVSRKGAHGLMQLLPATARRFGVQRRKDLFDPAKNLEAGIRYLKWLSERFSGDAARVLAAYNAGEGAVDRFGGVPPYPETRTYVTRIFGLLGLVPTLESPLAPILPDTEEYALAAGR
jgi:soluble lytic murein transglycosylase-like protein